MKFDSPCPFHAHFVPCVNLILKDFCAFRHSLNVRTAYEYQTNQILKNLPIEEKTISIILKIDTYEEQTVKANYVFLKKFPDQPNERTRQFIASLRENPRKSEFIVNYMNKDKKEQEFFDQKVENLMIPPEIGNQSSDTQVS